MPATSVIGWKHACSCYALFCYWMSMLLRKKGRILQSERKFVGFISYLVLAKLLLMHGVCVCMPQ